MSKLTKIFKLSFLSAVFFSTSVFAQSDTLRIGAQSYPLYSPINLAHNLGYIQEELAKVGAKEEWTNFVSGPLVNEAVAAGEADVGFMADLPAIIAKSNGLNIKLISNVATGESALAVLVKPNSKIQKVEDLKDKKIAFAVGSYAQHLLALVLGNENLSLNDVEVVNLGAADSPAALDSEEVDAIVIWEQFITKLTNQNKAKVLVDGTGIKRSNLVVYAVDDFAKENPKLIEAFIKAIDRGAKFIKENPDEAAEKLTETYQVSKEDLKQIFKKFNFSVALTQEDIDEIARVSAYAKKVDITPNNVDVNEFIDTTYLKEAGF